MYDDDTFKKDSSVIHPTRSSTDNKHFTHEFQFIKSNMHTKEYNFGQYMQLMLFVCSHPCMFHRFVIGYNFITFRLAISLSFTLFNVCKIFTRKIQFSTSLLYCLSRLYVSKLSFFHNAHKLLLVN